MIKESVDSLTVLQHKSKPQVCRKLKREVEFEEYLKYVKGAPFRFFLKFHSGARRLFEELGQYAGEDGYQKCRNCGA